MRSKRLIVLSALALFGLLAIAAISGHSTRVMVQSVEGLDHTRDVLIAADQVTATLFESVGNARGYAITRLPSFRERFDPSATALLARVDRLRTLTANDAAQRSPVDRLHILANRRVDLLRNLVRLTDTQAAKSEIDRTVMEGSIVDRDIADTVQTVRSQAVLQFRQQVLHVDAKRRYAIYGPWIISAIALFLFGLMVQQAAITLKRQRDIRDFLETSAIQSTLARQRAEQAAQMKDAFLATVSHELRTPLTSIIGWCDLLKSPSARGELIEDGLTNIAQAARVQSHLIEDLLDLSRIVGGHLVLTLRNVNAADIIDKAIAAVALSAQAKHIAIHKLLRDTCVLRADPMRVQQIVWNLLSNAIKFTPEGGVIEISMTCSNSHLQLVVKDNGEGIEPDLLPFVFERFRQGHPTGTRQGGLGLGLSIVKNLVELHGGTVVAESKGRGLGATFTVRLPLAGADQKVETGSASPEVMTSS